MPLLYTFGPLGPRLVRTSLEFSPYLIERGQPELAVEAIEQGREWDWYQLPVTQSTLPMRGFGGSTGQRSTPILHADLRISTKL